MGRSIASRGARRGFTDYLLLYAKGVAMGSADVVPGVSGGTIALLVGVYMELVTSIQTAASGRVLKVFSLRGIVEYWREIHGTFLLALGLGIGTAVFSLAKLISYLLAQYPVLVWAFFLGLIAASIWLISRRLPRWTWVRAGLFGLGTLAGLAVSFASRVAFLDGFWGHALAGSLAICAMILPGISGSFILLILGKYEGVISAVHTLDFSVLLPFAVGALVGLLSFSHLLAWLFRRWEHATLALLLGFMLGSLPRVWPWHIEGEDGAIQLFTPSQYAAYGEDNMLLMVSLCAVIGAGVVWFIETLGSRRA